MDVYQTIRELMDERDRLDALIAVLEARAIPEGKGGSGSGNSRRGRKFMSPAERRRVSERMRRYWKAKRGISTA